MVPEKWGYCMPSIYFLCMHICISKSLCRIYSPTYILILKGYFADSLGLVGIHKHNLMIVDMEAPIGGI